ncbi:MAG: DHA2 family efflux MFS transporter permease subunit [Rhodospirillales bacterium]
MRVFATAIALFTVASLACGLSRNLEGLIVFRLIQGAVAGFMVPLSQALLMNNFPPDKRGMALAVWVMTIVIAPIIGPILGGWITDNYHWSWIFLINIPVGIFACFTIWQLLGERETPRLIVPVDALGIGMLVIWVGCLQLMLDKGNELDWFHHPFIRMLAIVSGLVFVIFLIWELTEEHPVVDLALFKYRNFRNGVIALALGFAGFFATTILLPLWLQTQLNYTPGWAGLVLAPGGVLALILSPLVGEKHPARRSAQVRHRRVCPVRHPEFLALAFRHQRRLLHAGAAADAAGRGGGHVLPAAGDHQPVRGRDFARGQRHQPAKLSAHDGRQLRRFHRHYHVGPPPGAAPHAAGGKRVQLRAAHRRLHETADGLRSQPRPGPRLSRAHPERAGLHARGQRHLPGHRLDFPGADRADLDHQAAVRWRRRRPLRSP